jgi:hypothetical protein
MPSNAVVEELAAAVAVLAWVVAAALDHRWDMLAVVHAQTWAVCRGVVGHKCLQRDHRCHRIGHPCLPRAPRLAMQVAQTIPRLAHRDRATPE